MQTIGSSDIHIPTLSLGCMSLGTNRVKAIKIISQALDKGIIHLDTADLYDFGQNETIIGELIQHHRDQIVITTKVGNHFNKTTKDWFWDPSKTYIEKAVHESLKRLQTDHIDLYLLHGGTIDDPIDETIEAFDHFKKSGTIRAYGLSSIRPNVIKAYMERSQIDAVMMQYNILDRRPEEWLDELYAHQISVLARGPLAKGLLSSQSDSYIQNKAQDGYLTYTSNELSETLQALQSFDAPLEQLAFQYVLHHPAVASAIFGASTEEQVLQNSEYLNDKPMDDALYKEIQQRTKYSQYVQHR